MIDKKHAAALLDRLGPGQLAAVVHLLETFLETNVPPEEDRDTLSPSARK